MKLKNLWFSKIFLKNNRIRFAIAITTIAISFSSCSSSEDYSDANNSSTATEQTIDNQEPIIEQPIIEPTLKAVQVSNKITPEPVYNTPTPTEEPVVIKTVNLIAVGDDLIHGNVYESAILNDETYNFDSFFANIKDELAWADLKIINQETILVEDEKDYSGYPTFGSPQAVGDAIAKAGFNVVLHATNHTLDKGISGVQQTLSFWDNYKNQITVLGIHKNKDDYNTIDVIEVNGIKIALLNYTYGLNGFVLPSDKQYLVNTLYDKEKVANDIEKSDSLADLTIVFVHWGTEYVYDETEDQTDYANLMAEAGADLIIGEHPHVVEPLKYITTSDYRKVPVYYSLGNFISNQNKDERMLGAMAKVVITEDDGKISLDCEMLPLVTHKESDKPYTAYMLEDYTDKLGAKHKLRLTLNFLNTLFNDIVRDESKEKPIVYKKHHYHSINEFPY